MEWKMTLLNERNKGREEGRSEGIFETLCTLVKDGILTVKDAAERAGISEEAFKQKMDER